MSEHHPRHLAHWPVGLPHHLTLPQTSLWYNVEVSATRYPDKPFIIYYDSPLTYAGFRDECERLAGWLQQECGVKAGDRVLLYMQNSPQWVVAYYGILRANAVVVPINPMNRTEELRHYVQDSGASTALVAQDLYPQFAPLLGEGGAKGLRHLLVAAYSDYLRKPTDLNVPPVVAAPREAIAASGVTLWADMLARSLRPGPATAGPDDLCVMPYTSGTTGQPKGCMHTHRSTMSTLVGGVQWFNRTQDAVYLSVLPFFHVTGMSGSMSGPLFAGATIVLLSRWDRDVAARCIQRPKPQCLGIPVFDVDARVLDPNTLQEVAPGETGEIVVHAPQVMQGYWNQPQATADSFIAIDGRRFLRTGDLAYVDQDGYFFMVDRLKRMINASGYKVWPAEVEALMYKHPAIHEACVIAAHDEKRGETVKALVVLKEDARGTVSADDIVQWAHEHMAAYKSPRIVEFVPALPKSGSGKILWRELQEQELARTRS